MTCDSKFQGLDSVPKTVGSLLRRDRRTVNTAQQCDLSGQVHLTRQLGRI